MNNEPPSRNSLPFFRPLSLRLAGATARRRRAPADNRKLIPPVPFWVFTAALCAILAVHLLLRFY